MKPRWGATGEDRPYEPAPRKGLKGGSPQVGAPVQPVPAGQHLEGDDFKKNSSWAAILFAPTLVETIYGMNFETMPKLRWAAGYPFAILLMAVVYEPVRDLQEARLAVSIQRTSLIDLAQANCGPCPWRPRGEYLGRTRGMGSTKRSSAAYQGGRRPAQSSPTALHGNSPFGTPCISAA